MIKRWSKLITLLFVLSLIGCRRETNEVRLTEEPENQEQVLTGQELLDSVTLQIPEKLKITSRFLITGFDETLTTTYIMGRFERTEMITTEGKEYVIYNPNEKVTYQYSDFSNEGIKYTEEYDVVIEDRTEINLGLDYFIAPTEELIRAERILWKDYDTIYIETRDESFEGESFINKTWFSTRFGYPLKSETYFGEELLYDMEVLEITDEINIDEKFFLPPEHIVFEEFNMDIEIDFNIEEGVGLIDGIYR